MRLGPLTRHGVRPYGFAAIRREASQKLCHYMPHGAYTREGLTTIGREGAPTGRTFITCGRGATSTDRTVNTMEGEVHHQIEQSPNSEGNKSKSKNESNGNSNRQ